MRLSLTSIIAALFLVAMSIGERRVLQEDGSNNNQQPTLGKVVWQYDTGG